MAALNELNAFHRNVQQKCTQLLLLVYNLHSSLIISQMAVNYLYIYHAHSLQSTGANFCKTTYRFALALLLSIYDEGQNKCPSDAF